MHEHSAAMAKQMIGLQRAGVESMIGNMMIFWEQTGSMLNSFLNQAAWLPEEGKKAFREWVDSNKKGCETFKDAVNNGYNSLEKCFEKQA
ncbi:MAG: hypothetical protein ABSE08_12815 [Syntrophobacteraceae bacterium]